jgi:hypothetical protein
MLRAQHSWGSGHTTPTGDGISPEISPGAGADVPGGWPVVPVVPREELSRPGVGEGSKEKEVGGAKGRRGRRAAGRGRTG